MFIPEYNHPLVKDMAAWWLYDSDLAAGPTWYDTLREKNGGFTNGTLVGGASWGNDGLSFNGITGGVYLQSSNLAAVTDITKSWTITATFLISAFDTGVPQTVYSSSTSGNNRTIIQANTFGSAIALGIWNGARYSAASTNSITPNTRYCFVGVMESGILSAYLDARLQTGTDSSFFNTSNTFPTFGNSSDHYLHGRLFSASIFPRAISAAEVQQLYTESLNGYPNMLWRPKVNYFYVGTTGLLNLTSKFNTQIINTSNINVERNVNSKVYDYTYEYIEPTIQRKKSTTSLLDTYLRTQQNIQRLVTPLARSPTELSTNQNIKRPLNTQQISQTYNYSEYTFSTLIILQSVMLTETYSKINQNIEKNINSQQYSKSFLYTEQKIQRNGFSYASLQSFVRTEELIARPITTISYSETFDISETYIKRPLNTQQISQTSAKGNYSTVVQTYYPVMSMRRYSSQVFVQSGTVNDDGQ